MIEARFYEVRPHALRVDSDQPGFRFLLRQECLDQISKVAISNVIAPVELWCVEQFGSSSYQTWTRNRGMFVFWRSDLATAFKMRWC